MSETLFRKNVEVLKSIGSAALADRLSKAYENPDIRAYAQSLLENDGFALYGARSIDVAKAQGKNLNGLSKRIFCRPETFQPDAKRLATKVIERIEKQGAFSEALSYETTNPRAGFFICFGVGLGDIVNEILKNETFKHLIIIESDLSILLACMLHQNFAHWSDTINARFGAITMIDGSDAEQAASAIFYRLRGRFFSMLDGTYVFRHYESEMFASIFDALKALSPVLAVTDGFFEDELRMLMQAVKTARSEPYRLLSGATTHSIKPTPVFIVGSGPSVDKAMHIIKKFRDKVVLITCGTSMRTVLAEGLKPDFHVIVENTDIPTRAEQIVAEEYDFEDVILLGVMTVQLAAQAPFSKKLLNWREASVSSRLFAGPEQSMNLAVPTVTNFAARAAIALGFVDIRLFGVDLGSPNPEDHHSKNTIYYTSKTDSEFWSSGSGGGADPMSIEVPGSFCETVYTNTVFLAALHFFERLTHAFPNRRIANGSDGAAIKGAIAIRPEEMIVDEVGLSPDKAVALCYEEAIQKDIGEEVPTSRLLALEKSLEDWFLVAEQIISASDGDVGALVEKLVPLLGATSDSPEYSPDAAAKSIVTGTITTVLQYIWIVGRRIPADAQEKFNQATKAELVNLLQHMRVESHAAIQGLIDDP